MTIAANDTWRAFAKLNLDLRVLGERPDGYHEIWSVLQTIDFSDEIRVFRSGTFDFAATDGPADESNLVVRAVRSFERETGIDVRLRLELVKRIPSGSGLGGGSADAATTLLGLNRRFGAPIPGERLLPILATLGSDVPFFAIGGRALAIGRGEILFPLPAEQTYWIVLVTTDLSIDTAKAYSWLTESVRFNNMLSFCARFVSLRQEGDAASEVGTNDFETPLFRRFPELAEIKRKLWACGARSASLTGTGSAVFGQFASEAQAGEAAETLGREFNVTMTRPLGRPGYMSGMFGRAGFDRTRDGA